MSNPESQDTITNTEASIPTGTATPVTKISFSKCVLSPGNLPPNQIISGGQSLLAVVVLSMSECGHHAQELRYSTPLIIITTHAILDEQFNI